MVESTKDPFINKTLDKPNELTTETSSLSIEELRKSEYDPRHWGNCLCFYYKNHIPRITIGPDCIHLINIREILYNNNLNSYCYESTNTYIYYY